MSAIRPDSYASDGRVVFYDDFATGALDRSRWNVRVTGGVVNNEQQAYVDSPETLYVVPAAEVPGATQGGVLAVHPRYRPGHTTPGGRQFDFVSGRIDTRDQFDFCYGTAAARIKLPSGAGLWPAFWSMGYGPWPATGEIDIMEYVGESDWVSAAVHGAGYSGEGGLVNKLFFSTPDGATAWHVYSVEWRPDRLLFMVDGVPFYRITRPMTGFFGPWAFDNRKFLILNLALGGVYPFKTNGIAGPYYGLPESTVQLIKDGQVKMLVDWIKVES